jgi:electron transfer flavoprotein alpha subunit
VSGTTVLVLLDRAEPTGTLRPAVAELLTLARDLGDRVDGVSVGGDAPDATALEVLGRHGVATVHAVRTGAADPHLTPVLAEALRAAVDASGATTVLTASTFENKEAVARLAVATGAGVVTDASGAERDAEGRVVATKTVLAGTWTTRCAVLTPLAVVTVKAGAVAATPAPAASAPEVRTTDLDVPARGSRWWSGRRWRPPTDRTWPRRTPWWSAGAAPRATSGRWRSWPTCWGRRSARRVSPPTRAGSATRRRSGRPV